MTVSDCEFCGDVPLEFNCPLQILWRRAWDLHNSIYSPVFQGELSRARVGFSRRYFENRYSLTFSETISMGFGRFRYQFLMDDSVGL